MLWRGTFLLLATNSIRVVIYGRDQEIEWLGVFRKDTLFTFTRPIFVHRKRTIEGEAVNVGVGACRRSQVENRFEEIPTRSKSIWSVFVRFQNLVCSSSLKTKTHDVSRDENLVVNKVPVSAPSFSFLILVKQKKFSFERLPHSIRWSRKRDYEFASLPRHHAFQFEFTHLHYLIFLFSFQE